MKKKILKIVFYAGLVALTAYILLRMFQENGMQLITSLLQGNWWAHGLALGCALLYTVMEGCITAQLARRYVSQFRWTDGVINGFYVAFHKVVTFGTGSVVAMIYDLNRKGVKPELGYGIGTMQYSMHRLAVTFYATICILLNHSFFSTHYGEYTVFLYLSYGVTVVVVAALLAVCLSSRIHRWVLAFLRLVGIAGKRPDVAATLEQKMSAMQRETALLLAHDKIVLVRVFLLELVKLSCWFVIPYVVLWGMGGLNGLSLFQAVSVIAMVTILIGVIPCPGNIASIEIIYILLFTVVVSSVHAGASMLIYRFATFYLPFLVGIIVTLGLRLHHRHRD